MLTGAWALVVWVVAVMAGVVHRRLRAHPADGIRSARPRAARTGALVAIAGPIAGAEVAVAAWYGRPALGLLLAGPLFCLVMAAASVTAELAVRPSTAARRHATLASRHLLDYVRPRQLAAVCTTFAVAAVLLGTAALFGTADDKGRPGRWLGLTSLDGKQGSTILWPGAYYAVPLLVALGLALLAILTALRWIAARPRPDALADTPTADPVAVDDAVRRSAAEVVLAAGGVAAAAALCGAGLVAASGLASAGAPWNAIGVALWVVVGAVAAVGAWSAAILVTPGRVDRERRTTVAA